MYTFEIRIKLLNLFILKKLVNVVLSMYLQALVYVK